MSLNSSVSAMMACPFWPQLGRSSWTSVQIDTQQVGNLNSRGKAEERERQQLTLPTDGARWQRVAVSEMSQDLLCLGNYKRAPQSSRGQAQPGLEKRAWSRAYTPTRHRLRALYPGAMATSRGTGGTARSPHLTGAPTQLSVQGCPPRAPTAQGPQAHGSPSP